MELTPAMVRARVEALRAARGDAEGDHLDEDALYLEVLECIAEGSESAAELAAEALRTREFIKTRWYA